MTSTWTKESALGELRTLAKETKRLAPLPRQSEQHTRWILGVLGLLEEVFGRNSHFYAAFNTLTWSKRGSFLVGGPADPEGSWNPSRALERRHQVAYVKDLGMARGILLAAADKLERTTLASVYEGKDTAPESSLILKVINLAGPPLRKVIRTTPRNEREVQDAFENLLIGASIPYSRESDRFEYSSKSYVPDFTLEKISLAIDIKLCKDNGREKAIIAEVNDDIRAYQTKYGNLLFVVYDVGQIRDVDRFTTSFESDKVFVRIVKE